MKVKLTFDLDSIAEAEEVMQAVKNLKNKPYQLKGFGPPVITREVDDEVEMYAPPKFEPETPKLPPLRKNVRPGEPTISKIGEATKSIILDIFKINGGSVEATNFGTKYAEHLKLLWKRGEVCYDGTSYYLPSDFDKG